jgi:mono/diheme cytochrome c family protein
MRFRSSHRRLSAGWLLAVLAAMAMSVTACGDEPVAVPDDPELAQGQQIYNQRCATCHGLAGGGGQAPRLAGRMAQRFPEVQDQIDLVRQGVPGSNMRGFDDLPEPDEIEAVVRYTRESL